MRANAQVSKHYVTFSISREPITRYARYTRLAFRTLCVLQGTVLLHILCIGAN